MELNEYHLFTGMVLFGLCREPHPGPGHHSTIPAVQASPLERAEHRHDPREYDAQFYDGPPVSYVTSTGVRGSGGIHLPSNGIFQVTSFGWGQPDELPASFLRASSTSSHAASA